MSNRPVPRSLGLTLLWARRELLLSMRLEINMMYRCSCCQIDAAVHVSDDGFLDDPWGFIDPTTPDFKLSS